jgi:hypothetical protein
MDMIPALPAGRRIMDRLRVYPVLPWTIRVLRSLSTHSTPLGSTVWGVEICVTPDGLVGRTCMGDPFDVLRKDSWL